MLPIAAAVALARGIGGERRITTSVLPKLRECPIIPEEVQTLKMSFPG
jgi:hypothetical protein